MEKITLTEFVTNLFFLVFFSYSLCCILSPKTITTTITTTVSFTNITISLQHFDTTLRFLLSHLKSYQFHHWTISHYSLYLQTLNALFIIDVPSYYEHPSSISITVHSHRTLLIIFSTFYFFKIEWITLFYTNFHWMYLINYGCEFIWMLHLHS